MTRPILVTVYGALAWLFIIPTVVGVCVEAGWALRVIGGLLK